MQKSLAGVFQKKSQAGELFYTLESKEDICCYKVVFRPCLRTSLSAPISLTTAQVNGPRTLTPYLSILGSPCLRKLTIEAQRPHNFAESVCTVHYTRVTIFPWRFVNLSRQRGLFLVGVHRKSGACIALLGFMAKHERRAQSPIYLYSTACDLIARDRRH